jgi:RecA/RadA recombinase
MGLVDRIKKKEKNQKIMSIKPFQTPFLLVDLSLGGGIGEGVLSEAFAPEGLGKTTFFMQTMSFYLYQEPNSLFSVFDVEKSLDYDNLDYYFYQAFDEDIENFELDEDGILTINDEPRGYFTLLDTYEQINKEFKEFANDCLEEKKKGIVVWDSLVSAVSEQLLKGKSERIAWQATAIQEFIQENYPLMRKIPITVLAINQVRENIQQSLYSGNQDKGIALEGDIKLAGGRFHKFMAHQMIQLVYGGKWVSDSSEKIKGRVIRFIPTKNKLGSTRKEVKLIFLEDYGFSNIISILEFLKSLRKFEGTLNRGKFKDEFEELQSDIVGDRKNLNIVELVKALKEDDGILNKFYDLVFPVAFEYFKEHKREQRYKDNKVIENQRLAIKLDAKKLDYYLENIYKF